MRIVENLFIVGEICSGKDYLAGALADAFGYKILGIGQMIAAELEAMNHLERGYIYSTPEIKAQWRSRLQAHGNAKRVQDPKYWVEKWWQARASTPRTPMINTSCRFAAEALFAVSRGAMVLRVFTPKSVRFQRAKAMYPGVKETELHDASDAGVSSTPFHFYMPGTLPRIEIPPAFQFLLGLWYGAEQPLVTRAG